MDFTPFVNDHTTTSLYDLTHYFQGHSHQPRTNNQHAAIKRVWVVCVIEGFTEVSLMWKLETSELFSWILIVHSDGNKLHLSYKCVNVDTKNSPATYIVTYIYRLSAQLQWKHCYGIT